MKKIHLTYAKKTLSVFLTVLMLMSAWVFVPGEHNHASAAATTTTGKYNESLVNGLSALNTNVTTMYGSFDGDTQYVTNDSYSQLYKNVLHTSRVVLSSSTPAAQWKPSQWKDSNPADRIAIWHPTTVLLYDGSTTPEFGVVLEVDAANNIRIRSRSAYIYANANGLAFKQNWRGHVTGKLDHTFLMFNSGAKDYISSNGTAISGLEFNTDSGAWYFLANNLRFTDTMSNTEYLRTINPTYGYIGMQASGDSWHTLTGSSAHSVYVINYVPIKNATAQVNTWLNTIKNNPDKYSTACVKSFVNLYNKMVAAHPNNFASSSVCKPNDYNTAASTAMSAYNNFKLEERKQDITFENMFSISDWYNSASFNNYDTSKGEVTVENNSTIKIYKDITGGELTTSSSYSGNHQATMYSMPVTGGKDYTVRFNITSSVGSGTTAPEVFLFWYDVNNVPVTNIEGTNTFNNKGFSGNGNHSVTFTAPPTAVKAEIRFDNDCSSSGSTLRFNDIAVYPASRGTDYDIENWTTRPYTKAYENNASLGTTLTVPVRKGYDFNGWYLDGNNNGTKDDGEAVTDANGTVVSNLQTFAVGAHYNLYADWTPMTMDVGYDNLFSLSDWAKTSSSASSNASLGEVKYDLDKGTITVNTTNTEVYTNYGSASSHYQMAVEPNTEYIFKADMNLDAGTKGQMFVFFYKADGSGATGAIYNGSAQGNPHIGIYPTTSGTQSITFTTPADCTKMAIRVGATEKGTTATYSNIGFYKKADYDAYAKNYAKVREPFKLGETKSLLGPTRDGWVFDGWKLKDGTKITSTAGLTASTTVYANWTKLYAVKFLDGDNSTVLYTAYVKNGGTVDSLPTVTPTKASDATNKYEFEFWYANGVAFNENTAITADLNVFPVFKTTAHSSFTYSLEVESDCENNALVIKRCGVCGYNFGEVRYNPAEDANAASHTAWLAKGHDYSRGEILADSSTGNTDSDTHSIKCARYSTCGSVDKVKHEWQNMGTDGATCTTQGTVHWQCACLATKTTTGTTAPDVHINTRTVNNKDATCTEDGYTGDTYCDDCKKIVKTGEKIDKLGHSFTNYTSDDNATCTEDGTKTAKCDRCEATDTQPDVGSAKGHIWKDKGTDLYKAADCENDAVYWQTCDVCGISAKDDTTGSTWTKTGTKTGHAYTGTVRDNENGTHSYLCANGCNTYGYNGVKEDSKDCTYGDWSKTEAATHTKTCTECSYSVTKDHEWTDWKTVDGATNTAAAQHTRSCKDCDRVETESCEDSYEVTDRPETCTAPQLYTYTCKDCKHVYYVNGKEATGHNYTGEAKSYDNGQHNFLCVNGCNSYGVGETEGTRVGCTYEYKNNKAGEHQATCTECEYTFAEDCSGGQATCTAPATCDKCEKAYGDTAPHSFTGTPVKLDGDKHAYLCVYCSTEGLYGVGAVENDTENCSGGAATCTDKAVCDVCKDTHGELDADAHKWGDWTNIDGTETHKRVCEYDGEHTETAECYSPNPQIIAPDCETAGYTLNTCDFCGHTWNTGRTEPLGHDWSDWANNEDGTHTRVCEDETCKYGENGEAKTETADCTEENATFVVTDPTCTVGGYTTYTCKDCGYEWVDDCTDPTGHSYAKQTKKTDAKYQRTTKDCTTDWTYWYCCDNCDVSAETEVDKYENLEELYWVREEAAGHKFDEKKATEDYLATPATCTAKATYYYSCSVCGTSSEGAAEAKTFESGNTLGHDWQNTEKFIKSDSDCINNEVYYKECSRCNISSEGVTDETWEKENTKSGHEFDYEGGYTAGVAANCTEAGVKEHWTCETCGKHYADEEGTTEIAADKLVIAALKHDYKEIPAKAASCEEDGYTKHLQCQREGCGYRNVDYKVIPATGHDFKAENGYYCDEIYNYHAYKCTNCECYGVDGVKYSVDATDLDPVFEGGIVCSFTGEYVNYEDENGTHSHKLTCVCGNVQSAVCADENGPDYTDPECGVNGYYTYVCTVCGYEWTVEDADSALAHDYDGVAWTKVAGKDEHIRYCKNGCGESETGACYTENPLTGCGVQNVCDTCGGNFGEFTEHVWAEVEEASLLKDAATCTTNAVYYKKCSNCGEVSAELTWEKAGSKLSHAMTDYIYSVDGWKNIPEGFDKTSIKESTCCTEGKSISYCTRCDEYKTKVVKADTSKHQWEKDTEGNLLWVSVSGDCSTGITMTNRCTVEGCGKTQSKVEYDVEHTYEEVYVEYPTCKDEGVRIKKCVLCGETVTEHYNQETGLPADLKPTGEHTYEEISTTPATCTANAYKTLQCKVCKDTITEEIAGTMLEHAYIEYGEAAPSCETNGHSAYKKCADCGIEEGKTVIEALGHTDADADGKCDECYRVLYETDDGEKSCGCICHKENFLMKFIYKILNFFWKLFKISKSCDCGAVHW